MCMLVTQSCLTPWTVTHRAPLSMESSRQGYWSELPFPSPGDLPNPGIEPGSPALQVDSLPSELPGKPSRTAGSLFRTSQMGVTGHLLARSPCHSGAAVPAGPTQSRAGVLSPSGPACGYIWVPLLTPPWLSSLTLSPNVTSLCLSVLLCFLLLLRPC